MNGDLFSTREGIGNYLKRWYESLAADTTAMQEYIARGFSKSVMTVPDRMVDSVEDMLKTYQRNQNQANSDPYRPGENALFPVVFVAVAKEWTSADAAWGQRMVDRQYVMLEDEPGASVYGYRQAMGTRRVQIAILAAESATAASLATQLTHFVGLIRNRRFKAPYSWGQYTFDLPVVLETPDIMFMPVPTDYQNMTILVADISLKVLIPYLDAPKENEENDGTDNNPPGYLTVQEIHIGQHIGGTPEITAVPLSSIIVQVE